MPAHTNLCDPSRLSLLAGDRLPAEELSELEEHLAGCPKCQAALDRLAEEDVWLGAMRRCLTDETAAAEAVPPAAETLDFLAPSDLPDSIGRLGTYEIKGFLGRGGNGLVLKAVDPALNRTVAIKVMAVHLATTCAARQRFLREARAAAAVVHEHVVAVYAVDEAGKLPYLVMEYVPGRSLQERLDRQGPLSLLEILRIGMQAASGLAAAHAQGLVHRDIKPANILLDRGVERARLTDFGLARAAADAGLTQSWVVAGTPHYMAPEQARGEPVDHRADLFSLGSTLYAMCTGHPPFRAESPVALLRRVSDDLPRPVRELNTEVPAWLAGIIGQLHAKDPARRFQTAAEVADLLGRCLAHVQQPARHPLPPLAKKLGRRLAGPHFARRRLAAIAMTAALLVGLTLLALPRPWWDEQKPADAPPIAAAVVSKGAAVSDGQKRFDADFREGLAQVQEKIVAAQQASAVGTPGDWSAFEPRLAEIQRRTGALQHSLSAATEPSADPLDAQLRLLRQRLELLRQRAER